MSHFFYFSFFLTTQVLLCPFTFQGVDILHFLCRYYVLSLFCCTTFKYKCMQRTPERTSISESTLQSSSIREETTNKVMRKSEWVVEVM